MLYIVSLFAEAQKNRLLNRNPQLRDYVFGVSKSKKTLYALVQMRPLSDKIDLDKYDYMRLRKIIPLSIFQDAEAVVYATDDQIKVDKRRVFLAEDWVDAVAESILESMPPVYTGVLLTAWGATQRRKEQEGQA